MKKLFILIVGLASCLVAYGAVYFVSTKAARNLQNRPEPELAWLKEQFKLNDAEFQRVCALHSAYLPNCRTMCAKIDAKNAEIRRLLDHSTAITPDIQTALDEAARLRSQCQSQMLNHFFEVSQTMAPEQGKRYLEWVHNKTLRVNGGMGHSGAQNHNNSSESKSLM